jgi:ABC-type Zn uptake system ZnuABC Zn-binding protein ZnuA
MVGCQGTQNKLDSQTTSGVSNTNVVKVVTSTSILADWVENIGGNKVQVNHVIPSETDPHVFSPTPKDIQVIQESDIVFLIGASYEDSWLTKLSNNVVDVDKKLKFLSDGVSLKKYISDAEEHGDHGDEDGHGDEDEHDNGHGEFDPHFWHDPTLIIGAVQKIAEDLGSIQKEEQAAFDLNADTYINNLKELDGWIITMIDTIPTTNRVLITSHESMRYFADRYGFEASISIIQSISSSESVTPKQLVRIIGLIEQHQTPAIFTDSYISSKIEKSLSDETGVEVIRLNMESLTDVGDNSSSYISMMKGNITKLVNGLKD